MIYGSGIDIEEISRFDKFLQQATSYSPFSFIFTKKELENYKLFNESLCLTLGFSCKEAFFKAFGKSWVNSNINWTDIELIFLDEPQEKTYVINLYRAVQKIITQDAIITPAKTDYTICKNYVVFETILLCRTK